MPDDGADQMTRAATPAAPDPAADHAAAPVPPVADPAADGLGAMPPPPLRHDDHAAAGAMPRDADPPPPPYADFDDGPSSFAHEPPFRARRNPARLWTIAAAIFAAVSLGVVGATAWWGLPDWMPFSHSLFAQGQPGLKLDFPQKQQNRHQLTDNTWYYGVSGTVTNTSGVSRSVPAILIVLRDSRGRVVYNAEVRSPKRVLAPGESVAIDEALVQVPKAAVKAEIGWKPG